MRRWMTIALFVSACGGAAEPTAAPEKPGAEAPKAAAGSRSDVDVDGLKQALADGASLIDVRTPAEFAEGHVPGAVNVPLQELSASHEGVAKHDKSKPLYVVCRSGGRSSRASDQLAKEGFTTVNITGGTLAWIAKGYPVE